MPVDEALYPVNLVLRGRPCLVVGGGAVAARKVAGLLAAGAQVRVVATVLGDQLQTLAAEGRLAVDQRPYAIGDIGEAWLVVTATDDPEVNAAVRADGDAARVWVNAADDPSACSFTLPAVVRQGPVMVTVSTSGQSPALATWLKAHVDEHLGPEYAILAGLLGDARSGLQAAGRSTEDVNWRPALDWDMLDTIRRGDLKRARERLEACLSSSLD